MRVIEIAPLYKWASGPVTVLCGVVAQLINHGVEVCIYSPQNHDAEIAEVFGSLGVEVFSDYNRLSLELDRCRLVHFHGALKLRCVPLSRECRRRNIRYLISPHGNLMPGALAYHRLRKQAALCTALRPYLEGAVGYHALTAEERDAIHKRYCAKVTVIPNGIKLPESVGKPAVSGADDGGRLIGFLGRIDIHHKGLDLLLEAVSMVSKELHGENTRILIAGPFKNASNRRTFKRLLAAIDSRVLQYIGPQYGVNKERFLEVCDAFVHTSRYEGMPMAVLEAMAWGLPCVVTEETNMGDILRSANAGLICSCSIEAIATSLLEVCRMEKPRLQQMGENGKQWVIDNLTWSKVADRYLEMYNDYAGD